jgi:hypothetical protein
VPVLLQTVTGSHIGYLQGIRWTYYFQKLSAVDKTQAPYISKGAILLDDRYGRLMRVMDVRYPNAADLGEITLFRPVDSDGNPATVVPSDGDGMLLQEYAASNTVYQRWVWVVPPAMAGTPAAANVPPKVAGRNPCVGVYQGQL